MVNMLAINAALSSVKAAKDITEAMIGLRDGAAFQEKRIELQSKLLDAQQFIFTVHDERATDIQRISALEKEIADMRAWETEKQRYELKRVGYGAFAYVIKDAMKGTEPAHWICTTCYDNGKKSILQGATEKGMGLFTKCFTCKTQIDAQVPHIQTFTDSN